MEDAGLMDELPSLAIRGICDYCDSHKNKQWQEYAALSAAACAKSLLSIVPVWVSEREAIEKAKLAEEREACLRSLFLTDPVDIKNALRRLKGDRAPGTCEWILKTDELIHWMEGPEVTGHDTPNILWLYGNPGTGKSTMVMTVVEELPKEPSFATRERNLAYFFCDSNAEKQRSAIHILRGLLFQLVKQSPALMGYILPIYRERKDSYFESFDALWGILMSMGENASSEILCVIDAVDECEPESQQVLLRQISQSFPRSRTRNARPLHFKIIFTSRPYPEIREHLSRFNFKDLASYSAVREDLKAMIRENVKNLSERKQYPEQVAMEVSRILEEKAEGTFLWIGIACGELAGPKIQSRNAVRMLEKLPTGLHALYRRLLDSALSDENFSEDKEAVVDILRFVAFARRPLLIRELSALCRLYPDYNQASRLQFTTELIDLCRLLIVIQNDRVQLLHTSVKDFLVREEYQVDNLKAHADLADNCIKHMMDHFGPDKRSNPEYSYLDYAAMYWPEHASLAETKFTIVPQSSPFFGARSAVWLKWIERYNYLARHRLRRLDDGFCALHAAARWGIVPLASWTLKGRTRYKDVEYATINGLTPLAEAARQGHVSVAHVLLERAEIEKASMAVLEAAAETYHHQNYRLPLHNTGSSPRQSPGAGVEWGNQIEFMRLFLDIWKDTAQITTELTATIVSNFDRTVVALLLDRFGHDIQVTDHIFMAAAGNNQDRKGVLTSLLKRCNDRIQISARSIYTVIQTLDETAVGPLLNQYGNQIQITDGLFKAAARNYQNADIMNLLLNLYGNSILVSEHREALDGHIFLRSCGECDYTVKPGYKTWQAYVEGNVDAPAKAFLAYWRSINRQGGERYHIIPFKRNPRFEGRKSELATLAELIMQQNKPSRIAVCGLGGIGKTQIALELAFCILERDSTHTIFWINCTSYSTFEWSYRYVANLLGIRDENLENIIEIVKAYLSQASAGKWLLIFDNADDRDMWADNSANISAPAKCLPESKHGSVLFTTRDQTLALTLTRHVMQVYELDPDLAPEILQNLLMRDLATDGDVSAAILLEQLAQHPLAITQAAAYINEVDITLSDYSSLFQEHELDLIELLSQVFEAGGQYNDSPPSILINWRISFERISRLNKLAADYLFFMACVHPHSIPYSLLPRGVSEKDRIDAIGLLMAFSFVNVDIGGRSMSVHKLVHLALRDWMRGQGILGVQILKTADRFLDVLDIQDISREMWREYVPHAFSLIQEGKLQEDEDKYVALLQKVGKFLYSDGSYNEAELLLMQVTDIRTKTLGLEHTETLNSMASLALIYQRQGRWDEAKTLGLEVVEMCKRVPGSGHPMTLTTIDSLAYAWKSQAKHENALGTLGKGNMFHRNGLLLKDPDALSSCALKGWDVVECSCSDDRPPGQCKSPHLTPERSIAADADLDNKPAQDHKEYTGTARWSLAGHPLFIASQSSLPATQAQDLDDVD